MINIKADILKQVVCESYKFGLNEEIQNKCNYLYEVIQEYNNIKPVAVANQIIVDIFTEAYEKIYQKTFDDLGIEYQGKSAKEICSGLVNYISDSADSKEDSVARIAAVNAMSKMYEYMENNNLELQSLDKVDNALMEQVLSTYVECYIWGRILNDLQFCLEKYSDDIDRTMKVEQEMKDYVSNKVRTTFQIKEIRDKIFGHHSIEDGIEALYEKC